MGGTQSQYSCVLVEVTPTFYHDNVVTNVTYKKNALFKLSKDDVEFLFGQNATVRNHSIDDNGKLLYTVYIPFKSISRLRAYIKEAWWKFTNSGDPVRASFVKEKVFFRTKGLKITKVNDPEDCR